MILEKINKHVSPPVFWGSNMLIFLLIAFTVFFGEAFVESIGKLETRFLESFGWAYILPMVFLFFTLSKILYCFPNVKIGGEGAQKEFSNLAWISMLFSAGLGIGLLYSGTYESLAYYFNAPHIQGMESGERFIAALHISYFHWGAPGWVIYGSAGLMMAFSGFDENKKFLFSSYASFKNKWFHHAINIIAIVSILLGVVTAFALGVQQINTGLNIVFPALPVGRLVQVLIVAAVTVVATLSVLSGLKKGIKFLSLINICLASFIFLMVFFNDFTKFIFQYFN